MAKGKPEAKESVAEATEVLFGSPDWIEQNVVPLGERGAKLWRHLQGTFGGDPGKLQQQWERYAKDAPNWK